MIGIMYVCCRKLQYPLAPY